MTMRGMFESATWPLRKLFWLIEEKVLWPIADAFRRLTGRSFAHSRIEAAPTRVEPLPEVAPELTAEETEAGTEEVKRPLMPRTRTRFRARRALIGRPGRELTIVLATVAVAVAAGIGIAKIAGGPNVKPAPDSTQARVATPGIAAPAPTAPATQTPAEPTKLEGVAPSFKSQSKASANGKSASDTQTSTAQRANSAPSSIPPAAANDISALNTARDFAGAFVLYEVGKSNRKVRQTFARTATPALAKALRDRPPRLPNSVKVPTAKVQNVVLGVGAKKGNRVDASVSLLRLGALSELRLTLTRHKGTWAVSEVRG